MPSNKTKKATQAHLLPEDYKEFKSIAIHKDWSVKKLNEKIVKLFLLEVKENALRINDL